MKKTRMALCSIVLCVAALMLSVSTSFTPSVFASSLSGTGSSISPLRTDIRSLTPNMNCPQPPSNVDHATLSNADLARYGMPRYQAGTDINIWKADVRAMKHRVCSGIPINRTSSFASRMHTNTLLMPKTPSCSPFNLNLSAAGQVFWTGNVAVNSATDSSCTQGNQYTEADTMYFVPCVASGSPSGFESSWVGLGGVNGANLVQTGTESDSGGTYYAWTENVGAANHQDWLFSVNCGDRIQVKAFHSNETTIQDFNNGDYNDTAYGPAASYNTAEWIVERTEQCDIFGNNCTPGPLADFQSETFYGLGTTLRSGAYLSPNDIDHDYSNMGGKTNIGPLAHNTLYGPPDYSNTITWVHQ